VPREAIEARHPRTLALIRQAVKKVDRAFVIDNSRRDKGFTLVLTFEAGRLRSLAG
jgi:predicted ABC-type ATPase